MSYQLPGETLIKNFEGKWERISALQLNELSTGFIFCDFLKRDIYHFSPINELPSLPSNIQCELLNDKLNTSISETDYLSQCKEFIDICKVGKLSKIVLSRTKEVPLPTNFDLGNYFIRLCHTYAHSFNYLVSIPDVGTWIGATPEQLLVKNNSGFNTVALAGTRAIDSKVPFTSKEKEEQQFVTTYIEQLLNKGMYSYTRDEQPSIVAAGNLLHLKSNFHIAPVSNPLQLALQLHPTPAVCGIPLYNSLQYITDKEGYNRKFYTGFLGILDKENFALYVNLRCAELLQDKIRIYIGGGITAESNPKDEWIETENKSKTLLHLLE